MTLRFRTLSLLVAFAAVWAQTPATQARPDMASAPKISISNATVKEGDSGTKKAVFKVTLSKGADATVHYTTLHRTATAGSDYKQAKGTLTFRDGQTVRRIVVKVFGDTDPEPDEKFRIVLSKSTGATIADHIGIGTIMDDDSASGPASLSIGDATVTEGDTGTTPAVFDVTLSTASASIVTVDFATDDGSAADAVDFHPTTGTLTFNPGQTSKSVTVKVDGDTIVETNETFLLILSNSSGATIANGTGLGTITNDDGPGTLPSIAIAAATVAEGNSGNTAFVFNLTLSAPSGRTVSVDYATADGSAVSPGDYASTIGTVTFNPGQASKQIVVQVQGDTAIETNETFSVNLSNPTNATIPGSGSAIGTITNDDNLPSIAIAAATVAEGNSGNTAFVFNLTLSAPSGSTVSVDYATADGSAVSPGDYASTIGTVTFNPGQTSKQITVQVGGDTANETNETFSVNLSNPTNATISGAGFALGTITNDDAVPSIAIAAATVAEGNSGNTAFVFNLTLSAPSGSTVTVDYATADGSAVAPGDYASTGGTVTFNPGQTSKQIVVQVQGDTANETNETFSVNLSNPTNATISGAGFALGTITNDDAVPSIAIAAVTLAEGNSGNTAFVFNLTLSAPSGSTVTVDHATADGTAIAPGDYASAIGTVTFDPGQISKQIVVQVKGETLHETNEAFSVILSNPTNATISGAGFALGTINNDDAIPTLSINNVTALEGNAGSTNFVFTVTLSAASGQTVTVDFATANGSAVAPGDYTTNNGTVTFNPGTTTQTITIQVVGDSVLEANETFTVNLSNPTNATVSGTGVGTGTITNDDA